MIQTIAKFASVIAFLGAMYWVYAQPREIEPYVTLAALLAAVAASFSDLMVRKAPQIWLKAVGIEKFEIGMTPEIVFEFENVGDADAHNLVVETGVSVLDKELVDPPPPMKFPTTSPTTFLP